jgi:single-strand DNA-binding protein
MTGEPLITVVGNLTADPELRFTPSGAAVANFTVAQTPRTFNRDTNAWDDGETLFMRCSIWREAAENVAESLFKGMRVVATGKLKQRSYDTKEGEKRTVIEMDVDEVGPSLRYASAKVTKAERSNGQQQGRAPQPGQQQGDPWATGGVPSGGQQAYGGPPQQPRQGPPQGQQQPWGQQPYDEPPF